MRRTQSGLGYLPIHFGRSLEPISDPSLEKLGWTVVCATSHLRVDAEHARLVLDQDWITLKKRAQDLILSTYGLVRAPES